jgi:hypothetical protein
MQFIQASINKSKHQELREKVTAIIRNWNTIVDEINSQFPKGNSLKLLLKKDDDLNHFV